MADKKRIHIDLVFSINDLSGVQNLRDQIKTELTSMDIDIYKRDINAGFYRDGLDGTGDIHLYLQIRFKRNHTQFRDFMNTLRQSIPANKLLVGSKVSIHNCNHDDADVHPCVETVIWEKT